MPPPGRPLAAGSLIIHVLNPKALATPKTPTKTGLAASRFADDTGDDAAAAGVTTGATAEGEPDHSSAALALVRKPLATCTVYLCSLHLSTSLFFKSLGSAVRHAGGSVLTDLLVKIARMRHTCASLESLDSDMREQNLRILRSMEEATTAKISSKNDVNQVA
jgi:hypothetical protein